MDIKYKRATVYLDSKLHWALKVKEAQVERTMSELINEAVSRSLTEDYEDLSAFEERKKEPNLDFEVILKELKKSGRL